MQQFGCWALSNLAVSGEAVARAMKKKGAIEVNATLSYFLSIRVISLFLSIRVISLFLSIRGKVGWLFVISLFAFQFSRITYSLFLQVCRIAIETHPKNAEVLRQARNAMGAFAPLPAPGNTNHK